MSTMNAASMPRDTWQDTVLLADDERPGRRWHDEDLHDDAGAVLPLRFTGSGSEYFRIWIVNLLLTLLTFGLYYPWAKARKLRYFHGNTLVGEHPLGFHGNPWRMLRGTLLIAALLGLYSFAGNVSPAAGAFAVLVLALLWPALIKSTLQFRLANTSWRGLRLRFDGSTTGAYVALLPAVLPLALFVALAGSAPERPGNGFALMLLAVMGLALATVPWLWFRLKRYQHAHYAFGTERTDLLCGAGAFYRAWLKMGGVGMAYGLVVGLVLGLVAWMSRGPRGAGFFVAASLVGLAAWVLGVVVLRSYFTARMQNLVWSATASQHIRFDSRLRVRELARLTLKNWLLMLPTLGLYWPFAAVAVHRLRVEAVAMTLEIDPERIVQAARRDEGEAAGDAAGDLFGLDIGF